MVSKIGESISSLYSKSLDNPREYFGAILIGFSFVNLFYQCVFNKADPSKAKPLTAKQYSQIKGPNHPDTILKQIREARAKLPKS